MIILGIEQGLKYSPFFFENPLLFPLWQKVLPKILRTEAKLTDELENK